MMKIPDINAVRDWCLEKFALKTQLPDMEGYAKKDEVPTKTSELVNDKGFITEMPIAAGSRAGAVKPDGTTIVISADGTISAVGGGGGAGPVQLLEEPVNGLGLQLVSPEDILEAEEEN